MKHRLLFTLIAWCVSIGLLYAQGRTISGTVKDVASGEGIPGVSVYIKGTTSGVSTDGDGKYQLEVPNATGDVVIFSLVGYKNQEVTLGAEAEVNVSLETDGILDEVVVTALGIEKNKKGLGIAVTEVKAAEIQNTRATNVVNSLAGRVAGVRVASSNGMVGSSSSVFIRGFTTLTSSNQPLFVVDGIPIDNSSTGYTTTGSATAGNSVNTGVANSNRGIDLNPDDIESMSILKGPAAAVLYGSRAAGGAIIITTKKGKAGKLRIDLTSSYQVSDVTRFPDYQNQYGQGENGVFRGASNVNWGEPFGTRQTFLNALGQQEVYQAYPNNVKDLFKQGNNLQNAISLSGGNEKNTFTVSYSNTIENGVIESNRLNRNTFRVAGKSQLNNKLSVGMSITYFNTYSTRTQVGNQLSNPMFRNWFMPRNIHADNYPLTNPASGAPNFWYDTADNPRWTVLNNRYQDESNRLLGNLNLTYDILDWLTLDYKIGTDYVNYTINTYDAVGARGRANHNVTGGVGAIGKRVNQSLLTSSYLNLSARKKINDDFGLYVLVGQELNESRDINRFAFGNTVAIPDFENLSNVTTFVPTNSENTSRLMGIYANAQLSYKDYVFLDLSARKDWSSTFSKENRTYLYPSASLSVVVSDMIESLKDNKWLSFAKIRLNYARVGRIAPVYATNTYFNSPTQISDGFGPRMTFPVFGLPGLTLDDAAGNPDIKPEFTSTREIGTELKFFNKRLSVDLGYFNTKTTDILAFIPVAATSGFTNILLNTASMTSKGIELTIGGTPVRVNGFQWDISLNWTRIRTIVDEVAAGVTSVNIPGGFTTPSSRLSVGEPYGVFYGNTFERHTDGRLLVRPRGLPNSNPVAKKIGDPNPDWTAGITNTLSYKGISFSFLLDIKKGGDLISNTTLNIRRAGASIETGDRNRMYIVPGVKANELGQPLTDVGGNPIANDVQLTAQEFWQGVSDAAVDEAYVFDASWVRLREASLTYTLPKNITEKVKLSNVEIGITGRNLLLWAPNIPHIDPEVNLRGASNLQGIEFNAMPQTRNLGFVLRLSY